MVLLSVGFCLACYPALLHYDGLTSWKQVIGDSPWSDGHPVTFTVLVWLVCRLAENPFPFTLLQTALWVATSFYALSLLERRAGRFACVLYTALTSVLGLAMYSMLGTLQKDVLFTLCMLGLSLALFELATGGSSRGALLRLGAYALGVLLTRHGMLLVVGGAALGCALLLRKSARRCARNALLTLLCAALCSLGLHAGTMRLTGATAEAGYTDYTVPMYLLAAYAANSDAVDEETVALMERIAPLELWREGYRSDPYFADTVSRTYGVLGDSVEKVDDERLGPELLRACFRFLTREPLTCLRSFFDINAIAWEISRPDGDAERVIVPLANTNPSVRVFYPHMVARRNALTELLDPVLIAAYDTPVLRTLIFRNGGNLFLLAMLLWLAARRRAARPMVVCLLPSAFLLGGLMLFCPCQETRYVLCVKLVSLFLLSLAPALMRPTLDKASGSAYDKE